ncbi:unnamed protein product [Penicillium roqueforti FM164]|uniref:Uncharacterized protein n=1 Tax=Penicillium roqueforti (strain FM164) TaxID=1365484 RepID=W6QPZ9_PENRF|nr:unnamed protein product [Penicillium roqueforti FM164]
MSGLFRRGAPSLGYTMWYTKCVEKPAIYAFTEILNFGGIATLNTTGNVVDLLGQNIPSHEQRAF